MKNICQDCEEYRELVPIKDNINRQTYYICDECNEKRYDDFIGDYY